MMIINAGSENKGGTFEQALINAKEWYESIVKEFPEVTMSAKEQLIHGDWRFYFFHKVTGVTVPLSIHGFTKEQCEAFMFHPRVYWNGSSTANPEKEDWLTNDFSYKIQYFKL